MSKNKKDLESKIHAIELALKEIGGNRYDQCSGVIGTLLGKYVMPDKQEDFLNDLLGLIKNPFAS